MERLTRTQIVVLLVNVLVLMPLFIMLLLGWASAFFDRRWWDALDTTGAVVATAVLWFRLQVRSGLTLPQQESENV